jgi:hypothetical protein
MSDTGLDSIDEIHAAPCYPKMQPINDRRIRLSKRIKNQRIRELDRFLEKFRIVDVQKKRKEAYDLWARVCASAYVGTLTGSAQSP